MNIKIRKVLLTLLDDHIKVASWGISNINVNETSLEFEVSGFIFEGKVTINPHNSDYQVCFNNGAIIECSLSDLVDMLDSKIEKTLEYDSKIQGWLDKKKLFP